MRLRVNECAMRLWDEWTMRLRKMSECTMRCMRGVDDAFKKCTMRFKSEGMYDAFMEWMDDAFMCVFFFFFEFVWLLWLCRHEMSCSDETDFHRTVKWSVHLVSWYPIRLVHLRFHRLVVGESPPWLLSVDGTLVTNDVFAHWELVFPSSDCASSWSMCVFVCVCSLPVFFSLGPHCLRWQRFGCSSHVFCEAGESGLSSHIRLRFYSGLFT